jgi:carboxyl-terminal processing protease
VSDDVFNDFVKFVQKSEKKYNSKTEKSVDFTLEQAEKEKLDELIKEDILAIKEKLATNKIAELIKEKKEIKQLLKSEIMTRLFYRKGEIESSLDEDKMVVRAQSILQNKEAYSQYLAGIVDNSKEN